MLCIASAGAVTALVASSFTLSWTHSVEQTQWEERWQVGAQELELVEASVEGSGAGIAVPPDATWTGTRWTYTPQMPPLPELVLAASGATPSPWTLCTADTCHTLGATAGEPVRIWSSPRCE
jgi:hypothetical protein